MYGADTLQRIRRIRDETKHCEVPAILDEINNFQNNRSKDKEFISASEKLFLQFSERALEDSEENDTISNYADTLLAAKETELVKLRKVKDVLLERIHTLDVKYEDKVQEKAALDLAMENFQTDKDVILAFKLATLSHFSYGGRLKFGYLLDDKTNVMQVFEFDPDKAPTKEEVQEKWNILKSFIGKMKLQK